MIKYSIIIPHKNTIITLQRLLKSISRNKNIQVLIIDDNSSDEVVLQLRKLKLNVNSKIIFSDFSNGGGYARNLGLKHAKGRWIIFADSDDYFSDNIKSILDRSYDVDADIIYLNTDSYDDKGQQSYRHIRYSKLVLDFVNDKKNEDALRYYFTPPWGKIIKRDLILDHKIKFDEIVSSNDVMFSLRTSFFAKKIAVDADIFYIITLSKGSVTQIISKRHFNSKFITAIMANKFLIKIGKKKYQQSVLYFLAKSYIFGLKYFLYVLKEIIINRSNLFIGLEKLLYLKETISRRENRKYVIKKEEK